VPVIGGRLTHTAPVRKRCRGLSHYGRGLVAIGCLLGLLLAAGCGDSDEPVAEGPLPTGPDSPQAYTEAFLADNPQAELQPEHLVIDNLEPDGGTEEDTCAGRTGVDCLPYEFEDEEMLLTLSADDAPEELAEMVLRKRGGRTVLVYRSGGEPVSALVPRGEYVLELHHAFA